jgi:hypothetical protein
VYVSHMIVPPGSMVVKCAYRRFVTSRNQGLPHSCIGPSGDRYGYVTVFPGTMSGVTSGVDR